MRRPSWFFLGLALAALGLLIGVVGTSYGSFSPRGYVAAHYARSASNDIGGDATAYTSSRPPSQVADEMTGAWQPADRYVDGSGVYLRYTEDAVVIRPAAAGSLILVENLRTAYPRYLGVVGGYWGWSRGTTVRGGGPGAGK